jgi:gamma-glutamylcyclotransferase
MDNHHKIVAAAREQQKGTPPRRYFGYATVLDRQAFEEWRSQHGYADFKLPPGVVAEALDLDLTFDFPSRFWGGRVAGLIDAPGRSVWGLLFEIAGADWAVIEHKEGAVTGMCVPRPVRVRAGGEVVDALAFTTKPERASTGGPISAQFVEALGRGAESAGLPADYVTRIRAAV